MVQIIFPGCICYIYLDSTYYSHLKIFKKKRSSKRHLTPSFAWKLCTSMLTIVVCRTCVKVFSRQFSILSWIPSFSIMFRLWHHEKRGGFCIKIWSGHHFFIVKNRESGFSLFRQSGTASVHRGEVDVRPTCGNIWVQCCRWNLTPAYPFVYSCIYTLNERKLFPLYYSVIGAIHITLTSKIHPHRSIPHLFMLNYIMTKFVLAINNLHVLVEK